MACDERSLTRKCSAKTKIRCCCCCYCCYRFLTRQEIWLDNGEFLDAEETEQGGGHRQRLKMFVSRFEWP